MSQDQTRLTLIIVLELAPDCMLRHFPRRWGVDRKGNRTMGDVVNFNRGEQTHAETVAAEQAEILRAELIAKDAITRAVAAADAQGVADYMLGAMLSELVDIEVATYGAAEAIGNLEGRGRALRLGAGFGLVGAPVDALCYRCPLRRHG